MNYVSALEFSKDEQIINNKLNDLFKEWVSDAKNKTLPESYHAEDLVFEGIYPAYLAQPLKILFVGRESLGISGDNYIDIMYHHYKSHYIGGKHINNHPTHRRCMKIAYGLINDHPIYESIPDADLIANDFGTSKGISFSIMNISKFSNESDDYRSDWQLINNFISLFSGENYSAKQIEITDPDLIISMNLEGKIDKLGENEFVDYSNGVAYRKLIIGNKTYNVLDTYHFSAVKNDNSDFYEPIIAMLRKHNLK